MNRCEAFIKNEFRCNFTKIAKNENNLPSCPPVFCSSDSYPPQPSLISEGKSDTIPSLNKKRKAAFTLAEVLITLGVIGVVAALTMPSLIAHYQKKVLVDQIKKAYSTINEGFRQIMVNDGCTDYACAGFWGKDYAGRFSETNSNKIINTFKLSSVFVDSGLEPSFIPSHYMYNITYLKYEQSLPFAYLLGTSGGGGILGTCPDGMILWISNNRIGISDYYAMSILFDVNGEKGPNVVGRDIHELLLIENVITTKYTQTYRNTFKRLNPGLSFAIALQTDIEKNCSKEETESSGSSCLTKIINEGWQMNY